MHKRDALGTIARSAVLAGAALLFCACTPQPSATFQGIDLTGVDYGKDLPLPDFNGQPRHLRDFAGKVVVVFFGYTQCPDVCPTTLAELADVKRALGAQGDRLQALFVTVDPQRDTPEVLKAYVTYFDPSFLALRGTPEQLAAVAKDFRIYYKRVAGPTPTSYTMEHSAGSYLFDPAGRLRVYHRYGGGVQALTADVRALLQEKTP